MVEQVDSRGGQFSQLGQQSAQEIAQDDPTYVKIVAVVNEMTLIFSPQKWRIINRKRKVKGEANHVCKNVPSVRKRRYLFLVPWNARPEELFVAAMFQGRPVKNQVDVVQQESQGVSFFNLIVLPFCLRFGFGKYYFRFLGIFRL